MKTIVKVKDGWSPHWGEGVFYHVTGLPFSAHEPNLTNESREMIANSESDEVTIVQPKDESDGSPGWFEEHHYKRERRWSSFKNLEDPRPHMLIFDTWRRVE